MSYDIKLVGPDGATLESEREHDLRSGTYVVGGTPDAWLNITYNYSGHFQKVLGDSGIRSVYGMAGRDAALILLDAAEKLGRNVSKDYWEATEGNARKALLDLARLCGMFPNGILKGD